MGFKNIRPLHIVWQENIKLFQLAGVFDGIKLVLEKAGVGDKFQLRHCKSRREAEYKDKDEKLLRDKDQVYFNLSH